MTANHSIPSGEFGAYQSLDDDRWDHIRRRESQRFSGFSNNASDYHPWSGRHSSPAPSGVSGLDSQMSTSRRPSIGSLPEGPKDTRASLPPFASFSHHPGYPDDPDGPEIAPMSQRLACTSCTSLKPLVRDVAMAAADLDDCVQAICNTNVTRGPEIPADNSLRTAHWILDRLRYAKLDLQESHRRRSDPEGNLGLASQSVSSTLHLKRINEDQSAPTIFKRSRHHSSPEQQFRPRTNSMPPYNRRASGDPIAEGGQTRLLLSSTLRSESAVGSAHSCLSSPIRRRTRGLPSPAPSVYNLPREPPAPPRLMSHTSVSPMTSTRTMISSNTPVTEPTVSARFADLQRELTSRSLALEKLQSEHTLLLQTWEDGLAKSQTSQKRKTLAGQEIDGLVSKNRELTERIKGVESHLRTVEQKREDERDDAAKHKEQWTKMLDMSGQIQARQAEQCYKLKIEKDELLQRLTQYARSSSPSRVISLNMKTVQEMEISTTSNENFVVVMALKREIDTLTARNASLQGTLDSLRRQSTRIHHYVQNLMRTFQNGAPKNEASIQYSPSNIPKDEVGSTSLMAAWEPFSTSQSHSKSVGSGSKSPELYTAPQPMSTARSAEASGVTGSPQLRPGRQRTGLSTKDPAQALFRSRTSAPSYQSLSPAANPEPSRAPQRNQELANRSPGRVSSHDPLYPPSSIPNPTSTTPSVAHLVALHPRSSATSFHLPAQPARRGGAQQPVEPTPRISAAPSTSGPIQISRVNDPTVLRHPQHTSMLPPPRPLGSPRNMPDRIA